MTIGQEHYRKVCFEWTKTIALTADRNGILRRLPILLYRLKPMLARRRRLPRLIPRCGLMPMSVRRRLHLYRLFPPIRLFHRCSRSSRAPASPMGSSKMDTTRQPRLMGSSRAGSIAGRIPLRRPIRMGTVDLTDRFRLYIRLRIRIICLMEYSCPRSRLAIPWPLHPWCWEL